MRRQYKNHMIKNFDEILDMNESDKDQIQKKKFIRPFILNLKKKGVNEASNFFSILKLKFGLQSKEIATFIQRLILLYQDNYDNQSKREQMRLNSKEKNIVLTYFAMKIPNEMYYQFHDFILGSNSSKKINKKDFIILKEQIAKVSGMQIVKSDYLTPSNKHEKANEELPPKSIEIQDDAKLSEEPPPKSIEIQDDIKLFELINSKFIGIQDEEMCLTPYNYNYCENDEIYGNDLDFDSFL